MRQNSHDLVRGGELLTCQLVGWYCTIGHVGSHYFEGCYEIQLYF